MPCRTQLHRRWLCLALISSCFLTASVRAEVSVEEREFFEERIRPVLVKHCYECHSSEASSLSGDYALDTRSGLRAGGATGEAAITPGDPEASPLLKALRHDELKMPPEEKLPEAVIADFQRWIAMGAPDPRDGDAESLRQQAGDDGVKALWSLQKPVKPAPPQVKHDDWPRWPIDRFVLANLEQHDLLPAEDAGPRELIRRVYFDLTGLPPSPAEVESFVSDPSPSAFEAVVDSLLNSPRFGERWGRHWLDLARYAESSGMEFNFTYPHAWPYRDYVIQSFNEDKPYNRFVTEQLAGDLLPAATPEQRDENRLATGFLAIGPKRHNAGTTTFRMDMVDDQIKATTGAFLGLTAGCARCHDHKFDPIPTEDYYSLAGIFLSTKPLYGTTKIKYSRHPSERIPFGPNAETRHQQYEAHQKKLKDAKAALSKAEEKLKKLKDENKRADAEAQVKKLKARVEQLKSAAPAPPKYAMGASEGKPADTHVAIGGDPGNKGDTVPRGFLSAVPVAETPEVNGKSSGRLALARWITARDNPLTARVMVNRIWHHLFGRGIVPTVNNFGVLGKPPSHPELLDYLAVTFREDGWSVKRMIRAIVLSRTYQLSTRKDPAKYASDPQNIYLWRMTPRRLEAEPLRDAVLAVSGQLDLTPPEGSPVTALGQQLARGVSYEKINPPSRHRTVYLPVVRHYIRRMVQEFDFASASLVVGDRAETTTAQQALFLLNNDFVLKQAEATADLLLAQHPDDAAARIRSAFRRTLCRPPSQAEATAVAKFLRRTEEKLTTKYEDAGQRQRLALASLVQTLICSPEFRYLIHPPSEQPPAALAAKPGP